MIMAADSGMDFLYRNHLTPDIIVGDFDSVDHDALDFFREDKRIEFCRLDPVKDDTDTEYAIRDALSRGITQLTIIGGTGSRLDHVLGNISLLGIGLEENVEIELVDEHNRVRMIDKPLSIRRDEQFGRFVSLIPYTGNVEHVTLTGFKYTLDDYTMGGFNSLGVSNEIKEEVAHIEFSSGILLVIESVD